MKDVFLQFPSKSSFLQFIEMVDISNCRVGNLLFTISGKLPTPEIDMAVRDFQAKAIEYQLADVG